MKRRSIGLTAAAVSVVVAGAATGLNAAGADTVADSAGAATLAASPCVAGASYGDPLPASTVSATSVRDGFSFTEGPAWVADQGSLLFSDMQDAAGPEGVQPSSIWKFTPPETFEQLITDAGSNGLAVNVDGTQLIAATHDQRTVSSFSLSDLTRSVVASDYLGAHFNSPNDVTVAADGTVYFTDPNFQRADRADEMNGTTGVFRVSGGEVFLIDDTVSQPNGIALAPDGKTLYVGGLSNNRIFSYPVLADGSTGPRTTFATLSSPDGVTIDCAGNLYWASYSDGRIHVISPDGQEIGTITAGLNTTNAAFGGDDGQTLYITSSTPAGATPASWGIYSVQLNVPGSPY